MLQIATALENTYSMHINGTAYITSGFHRVSHKEAISGNETADHNMLVPRAETMMIGQVMKENDCEV
ncbi:MAG: hypothetical protein K0S75_1264 [Clostridia bacterium]|nr:hypothetical protein [Clostridia bacterium]